MELTTSLFQQVIDNGSVSLVQLLVWALSGLFFITTVIGGLLVKVVNDYLKDNKSLHKEHEKAFETINVLLGRHDVRISHLEEDKYIVKYPKE